MIEFEQAIDIAVENVRKLVSSANSVSVEEVVLSQDEKTFEVTLSYKQIGQDKLSTSDNSKGVHMGAALASFMDNRKRYKTFLVDSASGRFKGFKIYKGE